MVRMHLSTSLSISEAENLQTGYPARDASDSLREPFRVIPVVFGHGVAGTDRSRHLSWSG